MFYRAASYITVEEHSTSCCLLDILGESVYDGLAFEVNAAYFVAVSCWCWVYGYSEVKACVESFARE